MRKVGTNERFFETTRGKIVLHLMDAPRTVSELSGELDLTDNAVRAHLVALERDGVVRQQGERRSGGRPAFVYRATAEADELLPHAYDRALGRVLDALSGRMDAADLEDLLRDAGRGLVDEPAADAGPEERLRRAREVVEELGGLAEIEREEDGTVRLRSKSCPLSAVVRSHPAACRLAEGALEAVLGVPVETRCGTDDRPTCTFRATLPAAVGA